MKSFTSYKATRQLQELAKKPFDLAAPNALTPERLKNYLSKACGYQLFYGTERIDDRVMSGLKELAKESEAIAKMHQMQSGEIVNKIEGFPSEERPALHTATRDFFEERNSAKTASEAAKLAEAEIEKLKQFLAKIGDRFTDLVMIGIGGSDLGPRAHYVALQAWLKPNRRAHFICNVDPDDAAQKMRGLNLKQTLVVVVSKTGTTLETKTNEELARKKFEEAGLEPSKHFISVTMAGSPMDNHTRYLESFHIWDWVGGRYSTTSMVGGVLLSFSFGFDLYWKFLSGASAMDKMALKDDLKENLPLLAALLGIWNRNFLKYPTLAIIPYSEALLRYPAHIQQLDMESNGKQIDKQGNFVDFETGPIIWGEPGTNAQHSFYQLIHQGTSMVPLEFIGFKHSQLEDDLKVEGTLSQQKLLANLFAQMIGLATGKESDNPNQRFLGNRPSHLLLAEQLTPYSLGALLAFFEHKVAFQGFIWNINSFDQEGVQLGKVLANKIIDRYKNPNGTSYPLGDLFIEQAKT